MKNLSLLFAVVGFSPFFAQKNLIKNGSFELDASAWRGENILTINPYTKKIGDKGGNIYEYTAPSWKGIDQEFNIPKNTPAIEVSAWLKADAIEKGKNDWNKAVVVLDLGGKNQNIAELDGTTNWLLVKKVIPTFNQRSGRLMIALSECTGSFFFDDIKVTPLTKEAYDEIIDKETKEKELISLQNIQSQNINSNVSFFSNGNFENGMANWRGTAEISNAIKKEGNNALLIDSPTKGWTGVDQQFNIPANTKTVTVSGWLKSENIIQGDNSWNKGLLNLEFTKDGKNKTANDQNIVFLSGTNDWQFYSKTFEIPNETQLLRIMIALGFASGKLYADDIQVTFNK